ncbi:MAG: SCO family protein [Alphaproteobacteria bacterium]
MNTASDTTPPRRHLTGAIVPALAAAGLAGLAAMVVVSTQGEMGANAPPAGCITRQVGNIGGPISLLDTNGHGVTQADLTSSGASVVYFGFTRCPDACPTTMYALAQALQNPNGYDIQSVFITLDPERDTPAVMGAYVKTNGFPQGLIGLTGSPAQTKAAADEFKVSFAKTPTSDGDYTIDHTSLLYVMDATWHTAAVMPTNNATPQSIAACIAAGLRRAA